MLNVIRSQLKFVAYFVAVDAKFANATRDVYAGDYKSLWGFKVGMGGEFLHDFSSSGLVLCSLEKF